MNSQKPHHLSLLSLDTLTDMCDVAKPTAAFDFVDSTPLKPIKLLQKDCESENSLFASARLTDTSSVGHSDFWRLESDCEEDAVNYRRNSCMSISSECSFEAGHPFSDFSQSNLLENEEEPSQNFRVKEVDSMIAKSAFRKTATYLRGISKRRSLMTKIHLINQVQKIYEKTYKKFKMEKKQKANQINDAKREIKIPKANCYTTYTNTYTICSDMIGQPDTQTCLETTSDEDGSGASGYVGEINFPEMSNESQFKFCQANSNERQQKNSNNKNHAKQGNKIPQFKKTRVIPKNKSYQQQGRNNQKINEFSWLSELLFNSQDPGKRSNLLPIRMQSFVEIHLNKSPHNRRKRKGYVIRKLENVMHSLLSVLDQFDQMHCEISDLFRQQFNNLSELVDSKEMNKLVQI